MILESPVHPVPEGDPLTLRCLYHHTNSSNLTAEFYKDGSLLQTQTPGEMTIRTVSKSDEGLYHCKHPERGESPQSWISVRGNQLHRNMNPCVQQSQLYNDLTVFHVNLIQELHSQCPDCSVVYWQRLHICWCPSYWW